MAHLGMQEIVCYGGVKEQWLFFSFLLALRALHQVRELLGKFLPMCLQIVTNDSISFQEEGWLANDVKFALWWQIK